MRNPVWDEHRNTELFLSAAARAKSTGAASGRQWVEIRGHRVEQPMLVDDLRQARRATPRTAAQSYLGAAESTS
jgi:hypothetical protein